MATLTSDVQARLTQYLPQIRRISPQAIFESRHRHRTVRQGPYPNRRQARIK